MSRLRELSESERDELRALNSSVITAIQARRDWLDAKMVECSPIKVGDYIYNVLSGQQLGKVSKLYRYWRNRDEGVRDDMLTCDYEFNIYDNVFDNTSRHGGTLLFGTSEDVTPPGGEKI